MMLLVIYTVEKETKVRMKERRPHTAEQARLACRLWSSGASMQLKGRPQPETSALRRLVSALGYAGA